MSQVFKKTSLIVANDMCALTMNTFITHIHTKAHPINFVWSNYILVFFLQITGPQISPYASPVVVTNAHVRDHHSTDSKLTTISL